MKSAVGLSCSNQTKYYLKHKLSTMQWKQCTSGN